MLPILLTNNIYFDKGHAASTRVKVAVRLSRHRMRHQGAMESGAQTLMQAMVGIDLMSEGL
jgi:hypothetical protein